MLGSAVCKGWISLGLAAIWYLLLFILGMMPETPDAPGFLDFEHMDKLVHWGAYGLWGVLLFMNGKLPVWVLLPACLLALVQESSQILVAQRSFEWLDWTADSLGILSGWLVMMAWRYNFLPRGEVVT